MHYKGNPYVNSPPLHEVEELIETILNKPKNLTKEHKSYRTYTRFSKEGYKYQEIVCTTYSKVPKLIYIDTDVADSRWDFYPVSEKIIATSQNSTKSSHPEYMEAKVKNKG